MVLRTMVILEVRYLNLLDGHDHLGAHLLPATLCLPDSIRGKFLGLKKQKVGSRDLVYPPFRHALLTTNVFGERGRGGSACRISGQERHDALRSVHERLVRELQIQLSVDGKG